MTNALKMLVQQGIVIFGLSDSTIVLTKSFLQSSTSLSNINYLTFDRDQTLFLFTGHTGDLTLRFLL